VIYQRIDEGEQFWSAGHLDTMLIPRNETKCFEAVRFAMLSRSA
jgi:hypothetical protein